MHCVNVTSTSTDDGKFAKDSSRPQRIGRAVAAIWKGLRLQVRRPGFSLGVERDWSE